MDFYGLLKFIYKVSKLSGFLFITINFNVHKFTTKLEFRNRILLLISFGFSLVSNTYYDAHFPIAHITHSQLLEVGVNLMSRLTIFANFMMKVTNLVYSLKFFEILSTFQFVNMKVRNLENHLMEIYLIFLQFQSYKISSMTKAQIIRTALVFVVYNIIAIFTATVLVLTFKELDLTKYLSNKNRLFFFSSVFTNMLFSTTVMMTISCAYHQIQSLNAFIMECSNEPHRKSVGKVIREASIIHDKLCDLIDNFSTLYLFNILLFLIGFLYFSVFLCYAIFVYYQTPKVQSLLFLLSNFMWILYYIPCALWMVTFSSLTEHEGLRTADLIQQLMNVEKTSKPSRRLNIMMLQMSHRTLQISCGGMFVLNWKLFFSLMGGIFSFAIILIQFYDVAQN